MTNICGNIVAALVNQHENIFISPSLQLQEFEGDLGWKKHLLCAAILFITLPIWKLHNKQYWMQFLIQINQLLQVKVFQYLSLHIPLVWRDHVLIVILFMWLLSMACYCALLFYPMIHEGYKYRYFLLRIPCKYSIITTHIKIHNSAELM